MNDIPREAQGLSVALEERDAATSDHCNRVLALSRELGRRVALTVSDLRLLQLTAVFHDIGKIGIPDRVLRKREPLNDREWALMKTHSARGERILRASGLDGAEAIASAVRHHHERIDGTGYPDGQVGEAIPVLARIVAVADAYDAMAGTRAYEPPRTHRSIMRELFDAAGAQHDPYFITTFARFIDGSPLRAE